MCNRSFCEISFFLKGLIVVVITGSLSIDGGFSEGRLKLGNRLNKTKKIN
jgi:hypothetical protein